jgi:hypothetical protein
VVQKHLRNLESVFCEIPHRLFLSLTGNGLKAGTGTVLLLSIGTADDRSDMAVVATPL